MSTPKKWWQAYANDEEKRVFVGSDGKSGLVRSENFSWRTLKMLSSESGLTEKQVEGILSRHMKTGVVIQHQAGDKFGYWERVAEELKNPPAGTIAQDQQDRLKKAAKK